MKRKREPMKIEREYMTATEVAVILGVSMLTVIKQCRAGKLPCVRLGRMFRISRSAFQAWESEQFGKPFQMPEKK